MYKLVILSQGIKKMGFDILEFEKKYDHKPDFNQDGDVIMLRELAQKELEALRERIFNENVSPEQRETLTNQEADEWRINIKKNSGAISRGKKESGF